MSSAAGISRFLVPTSIIRFSRTNGVGGDFSDLCGAHYAMQFGSIRRRNNYGLTLGRYRSAITPPHNVQIASGELGGLPPIFEQQLTRTCDRSSRLQTAEDFRNILLKHPGRSARSVFTIRNGHLVVKIIQPITNIMAGPAFPPSRSLCGPGECRFKNRRSRHRRRLKN